MREMKVMKLAVAVAALTIALGACGKIQVGGSDKIREMDVALRATLDGPTPQYATKDIEGNKLWPQTCAFYERRQFAPAWLDKGRPRPQVDALVKSLREADREGLDPALYNVSMIEERRSMRRTWQTVSRTSPGRIRPGRSARNNSIRSPTSRRPSRKITSPSRCAS